MPQIDLANARRFRQALCLNMSDVTPIQAIHPFEGKWKPADDLSGVVVTITSQKNSFTVSAIDEYDDEVAEVSKVSFESDMLHFTLYWPSTGRQTNYRFLLQSKKAVSVTYTYTATEIWLKK